MLVKAEDTSLSTSLALNQEFLENFFPKLDDNKLKTISTTQNFFIPRAKHPETGFFFCRVTVIQGDSLGSEGNRIKLHLQKGNLHKGKLSMRIIDHCLYKDNDTAYPFRSTENQGGSVQHEYLVMHFTAGRSAESSINWLTNPQAKASAHVVVGRDGSITQLVPFNRVAWHAGSSTWQGRVGLNQYALGIELDNAGRLTKQGGRWRAWFGQEYEDSEVMEAIHKHETESSGWHIYTPVQIEAALELASLLVNHYNLHDVIGHDDIAPKRKSDPGPAFPMSSFRSRVMGRFEEQPMQYVTTTALNIRSGPGSQYAALAGSPLPNQTRVEVLSESGSWRFVDVLEQVNGIMDLQGWVHSRYLQRMD